MRRSNRIEDFADTVCELTGCSKDFLKAVPTEKRAILEEHFGSIKMVPLASEHLLSPMIAVDETTLPAPVSDAIVSEFLGLNPSPRDLVPYPRLAQVCFVMAQKDIQTSIFSKLVCQHDAIISKGTSFLLQQSMYKSSSAMLEQLFKFMSTSIAEKGLFNLCRQQTAHRVVLAYFFLIEDNIASEVNTRNVMAHEALHDLLNMISENEALVLCRDQFGYRTIQRLVSFYSAEKVSSIIGVLISNFMSLAKDAKANYVLQAVIDKVKDDPDYTDDFSHMTDVIFTFMDQLVADRFGFHVVKAWIQVVARNASAESTVLAFAELIMKCHDPNLSDRCSDLLTQVRMFGWEV